MDVTAIFAMCYSASLCLMVVCMLMGFLLGYNVHVIIESILVAIQKRKSQL